MPSDAERHPTQLRLFLEEICCELCMFRHVAEDGLEPASVRIHREVDLGDECGFADVLIEPEGQAPYFLEVKFGYPDEQVVRHVVRKYGRANSNGRRADRLILVLDGEGREDFEAVVRDVRAGVAPDTEVEVWDEARLRALVGERFGVRVGPLHGGDLVAVRTAIEEAQWRYAFDGDHADSPLRSSLLWHFGFWRLRRFRERGTLAPEAVLPPGVCRRVVVLMADLCSFSSYVRDTPDDQVVRDCLTSFYSKARFEVIDSGGMMYQFVGDEIIAMFGVPDDGEPHVEAALRCAAALVDIGNSVSNEWQRRIDRVQERRGVHIGMAMGDVRIVSHRPFSRSHFGAVADELNLAARLTAVAGPSEVVASNTVYQGLPHELQEAFEALEPIEARNLGMVNAWRLPGAAGSRR